MKLHNLSLKKIFSPLLFLLTLSLSLPSFAQSTPSFDAGPDLNDPMAVELVNLLAEFPDYAGLSIMLTGEQKFRPVFGPVPWRMLLKRNSVKILFQGQDATHIAEAAGRPATAGFGGRAMDLAKYLGVGPGAGFINAFASTIRGQYATNNSPIIELDSDGTPKRVIYQSYVSNEHWAMNMHPESPLVQFRNRLISWIIRNNPDSLKMVILFGGASRDAFSAFVENMGGKVGTRINPDQLSLYRVPKMKVVNAGGNNEVAYPLSQTGQDLYAEVLGEKKMNYREPMNPAEDYVSPTTTAQKKFSKNIAHYFSRLELITGGINGSGVLHPAQIGGYDIEKMFINGKKTISLKGLNLENGYEIKTDILVRSFPHPTYLSYLSKEEASKAVAASIKKILPYVKKGFVIPPDEGFNSVFFDSGADYEYARTQIGPETYDFGTPASRMVAVSSAVRLGQDVIVFGTRDKVAFNDQRSALKRMAMAQPSAYPDARELWATRPRGAKTRFQFDSGPSEKYFHLMKDPLPRNFIYQNHRTNRDYAHYRGTFKNPKVLILADPHGYDDLLSSRALTGSRGQYLHGIMEDIGVGDQYLLLKTAPFSKHEHDLELWKRSVQETRTYRKGLIQAILTDSQPDFIIADGSDAIREIRRIIGKDSDIPIINIRRASPGPRAGLKNGIQMIQNIPGYETTLSTIKMRNIPRTHLPFYARWWEGTSGDRVITSTHPKYAGKAFAMVAPQWAYQQKYPMPPLEQRAVENLKNIIRTSQLKITVSCNDALHKSQ